MNNLTAKLRINGEINIKTGMHIGTGGEIAVIGASDSPVVTDAVTALPIIPGSTLKGKLRTLLARKYTKGTLRNHDDDPGEIKRLFGSMGHFSRLIFSDMPLSNMQELEQDYNIYSPTEIKYENTINRLSCIANPRQIERVVRGAEFDLDLIYNVEDTAQAEDDMRLLADGFRMLRYDYLGGHGSRGYGRVELSNVYAEVISGALDDTLLNSINNILRTADHAQE